uniref:Glutamate rich 1 n=1 Tax=Macaca mulatta TaxID=9544 RepID=F7CW78_MACMU
MPWGEVFVEKVLQRLFPRVPSGQGKREPQTLAVQSPPKKVTSEKVSRKHAQPLTDASSETPTARRLYTASGPPEGYVPCWPEPSSCGSPEHASSGDDTEEKMARASPKHSLAAAELMEPPGPSGARGREKQGQDPSVSDPRGQCGNTAHKKQEPLSFFCCGFKHRDQDPHDQPKRRRIRKHKSKKKFKNPNSVLVEQAELEKQQSLLQEKLQRQHTDGPTISKNKKRKLKKKQQIKRKKAAGLATKAAGVSFMYQPEDSSSEGEGMGEAGEQGGADASQEDPTPAREEDIKDAGEEGGADASEEDPTPAGEEEGADASEEDLIPAGEDDGADAGEEDDTVTNEKADSVLNFLKSTQEMYFYDGVSRDAASAALADAAEELLGHLASHSVPPSDVSILHHLKTLLLLQDTERLKRALEMFPEHCTMPPDHARVISAFFSYWITHILPEKSSD